MLKIYTIFFGGGKELNLMKTRAIQGIDWLRNLFGPWEQVISQNSNFTEKK